MARRKKRKPQPRGYRVLERDGRYTAQVRVKGSDSAGKTFPTEAEADAWAVALVAELRKGKRDNVRRDITQLTVGDLNRAYLADPDTKAQKSYADTERRIDWWTNKFGAVKITDFGVAILREEARPLLMHKREPATVNRVMSCMRSAWNWGRDAGYVLNERAWPRRMMLREPRGIVRYLSDAELPRLLEAAERDPMLRIAILVSLATGMRQGELLRLRWRDIDLANSMLTVQQTKNDEIKVVHLVPEAVAALKSLKDLAVVSLTHPFVIHDRLTNKVKPLEKGTLEARWREIRKAAKLESRFRWHDLRHTAASYLVQNGASLLEIQEVLGHKTAGMSARYAHLRKGAAVTGHGKLGEMLRGK
jgi:integrase